MQVHVPLRPPWCVVLRIWRVTEQGRTVQSGTRECFEMLFGGVLGSANGKRTTQGGVNR